MPLVVFGQALKAMCGIAGVISLSASADVGAFHQHLRGMVDAMHHRGPDSAGVVLFTGAALGACRLAILGLEPASDQPLRSPDSHCAVVLNGEIFNYLELREELRSLGHTFVSSGDTEVVVHAYEEW